MAVALRAPSITNAARLRHLRPVTCISPRLVLRLSVARRAADSRPANSSTTDSSTGETSAAQVPAPPTNGDLLSTAEELIQELADTSSLGQRGEWYFAAQVVAVLLVLFPPFDLGALYNLASAGLLVSGLALGVYGLVTMGSIISPLPAPRKNHKLVTDGAYSIVRHPMYGCLILAAVGLSGITHSQDRLALTTVLWFVLEQKAAFEENQLVQRYGQEYEAYRDKTKKFIPYLY